jgi:hypothetical protein
MKTRVITVLYLAISILSLVFLECPAHAQGVDIRGSWTGKAQGTIFGAEGTVLITRQEGENIAGIVEGGNIFGTAKFTITGKVRGNSIYGTKDGHVFRGFVLADGSIRGEFRASDGESFQVVLHRPYPQWGNMPYGTQYYSPYGAPGRMW